MNPIDDETNCPSKKMSCPNLMKTNTPAIEEAYVFF
jgi:hypothetical protein